MWKKVVGPRTDHEFEMKKKMFSLEYNSKFESDCEICLISWEVINLMYQERTVPRSTGCYVHGDGSIFSLRPLFNITKYKK